MKLVFKAVGKKSFLKIGKFLEVFTSAIDPMIQFISRCPKNATCQIRKEWE
jgi:hypothetical protein